MTNPLPEPWDYAYEWDGPYGCRKLSVAPWNGRSPDRSVPIFAADQMRAYSDTENAQWKYLAQKHFDLWTEKSTENAALREQVQMLREALIYHQDQTRPITKTRAALEATR